ncbi:MAG TPA: HNH endonuclease signature motif containing protein [Methylomirabilota bacterium]|nr:HNH endonuclease signature motif containing protein [Methylomirabilota bacterium]
MIRGAASPGCGLRFVQGHHIQHWAHGGPTTLANLVLLCRRHHRAVHEDGYRITREEDGKLTFLRPDGRPLPESP